MKCKIVSGNLFYLDNHRQDQIYFETLRKKEENDEMQKLKIENNKLKVFEDKQQLLKKEDLVKNTVFYNILEANNIKKYQSTKTNNNPVYLLKKIKQENLKTLQSISEKSVFEKVKPKNNLNSLNLVEIYNYSSDSN